MPVIPPDEEMAFIIQLINKQQQQLNKLFQIAMLPNETSDMDELMDVLLAEGEGANQVARPPQGGSRITAEAL
jgi:hypothetical protein